MPPASRPAAAEWVAGNPADVLATDFGQPRSVFEKFPRKDVFIAGKGGEK